MFKKFLDEAEIDEWFEEEKERLSDEFFQKSFKGNTEDGREEYELRLKKLIKRLDLEHKKLNAKIARKERFLAPFIWMKKKFLSFISLQKEQMVVRKEQREKRKFNAKYDRLMKK